MSHLGINPDQPGNSDLTRLPILVPEQVRQTAGKFVQFLQEYCKFMHTVSSGSSMILQSMLTDMDLDEVESEQYLAHIQSSIAPYVPNPLYLDADLSVRGRAELLKKVVRYYYNTRGSTDSVAIFFQIFFNTVATQIQDKASDYNIRLRIQEWLTEISQPYGLTISNQAITAWEPFTYVIASPIEQSDYDAFYQALIHPIGLKYFALMSGVLAGILETTEGRMDHAKYDYQNTLWWMDSSPINEFATITIADGADTYHPGPTNTENYSYGDWSNIGAAYRYFIQGFLGLTSGSSPYYPLGFTSASSYLTSMNSPTALKAGMNVSNNTSTSAIPINTKISTVSNGLITLNALGTTYSGQTINQIIATPNVFPGMFVNDPNFPANTYVTNVSTSGTTSNGTFGSTLSTISLSSANIASNSQAVIPGIYADNIQYPNDLGGTRLTPPSYASVSGSYTFSAGWYKLDYVTGAVNYNKGFDYWSTYATLVFNTNSSSPMTNTLSARAIQVLTGSGYWYWGGSTATISSASAIAQNAGKSFIFYLPTTAAIGVSFEDNEFPDNIITTPPLSFALSKFNPTPYVSQIISVSAAATTTSNASVSTTTYSRLTYSYNGTPYVVYTGSTIVNVNSIAADSSIGIGNYASSLTYIPINTLVTQNSNGYKPQVYYTCSSACAVSTDKLSMIITVSTASFAAIKNIYTSSGGKVYVTGGQSTFGNYNAANGYVYVSSINTSSNSLTLKKSIIGSSFTTITTGTSVTANNVLIFTDTSPGTAVVLQNPNDTAEMG